MILPVLLFPSFLKGFSDFCSAANGNSTEESINTETRRKSLTPQRTTSVSVKFLLLRWLRELMLEFFLPLNPILCKAIVPSMTVRTYLEKAHRSAHVAVSYNLPTHATKTELFLICYNQVVLLVLSEHKENFLFLRCLTIHFFK